MAKHTLLTFMAQACRYAQQHCSPFDGEDGFDSASREIMFEPTSMMVACFLSQNTNNGDDGVCWDIVHTQLVEKELSEEQWCEIINNLAIELGGWKR